MKHGWLWLLAGVLGVTGLAAMPARADELAQSGRDIVTKWEKAVITVEVVIKTQGGGDEKGEEEKSEAIGVVIDPSGLVVASLTNTDPSSMYNDMADGMGDEGDKMKTTSQITGAKFILPEGGGDIQAQVVLRDTERDLIFLRPLKALDKPLVAMAMDQPGEPGLMDNVFLLNRMGAEANRAIGVTLARVQTVITKPRPCFMVSDLNDLGSPVFTVDGKLAGITVLRKSAKAGASRTTMRNGGVIPVVLPLKELAAAVAQVPAATAAPATAAPATDKK